MNVPPKEDPQSLQLRAKPKHVTRLNRKLIVLLLGTLSISVVVALMWGLRKPAKPGADVQQKQNVDRIARAEGLALLPHDYASIPKPPQLGAPAGELGRPVLRAEREAGIPELPEKSNFRPNAEEDAERVKHLKEQSEADQAAKSAVFVQSKNAGGSRGSASDHTFDVNAAAAMASDPLSLMKSATAPSALDPNKQEHKQGFVDKDTDSRIYASGSIQTPRSAYQLMAGSLIPAALVTGIKSDLPGQVIASVTENVFDTVTGQQLLIPQGSKLLGQYDSQIAYGQRRVLLVWTRLIRPNGSSIILDRLPGVDTQGYAGLEDKVDWHWDRIFAGAAITTLLGAGSELVAPNNQSTRPGTVVVAARESLQDTVNQDGQEMTRRNLDIQPTLTERPGLPLRVIVNKDLAFDGPYTH
jgi:type IV secretion system protein TrbI